MRVPSQLNSESNERNIVKENNESPNYPHFEKNNNQRGFSENLDWNNNDNNIVLQNNKNYSSKERNQELEIKNDPEGSNNARQIETNLDTLDESVCETIVKKY